MSATVPSTLSSTLFVIGEQRSGTTLLADLLDAQPGFRVATGLLTRTRRLALDFGLAADDTIPPRAHARLATALVGSLRASRIEARLQLEGCTTLAAMVRATVEAIRGDANVAGTKEHAPAASIAWLVRDHEAHVIYIVRDPRDAVLSRLHRGDPELDRKVASWRQTVQAALAVEHPRLHILRYEDLVRDVRGTLERVNDSFGWTLDLDRAVAWRLTRGHATNTSFGVEMRTVSAAPVERWREHVSEPWVRHAAAVCAPELRRLSYPAGPTLGVAEAARHRAVGAAAQLRRRAGDVRRRLLARSDRP